MMSRTMIVASLAIIMSCFLAELASSLTTDQPVQVTLGTTDAPETSAATSVAMVTESITTHSPDTATPRTENTTETMQSPTAAAATAAADTTTSTETTTTMYAEQTTAAATEQETETQTITTTTATIATTTTTETAAITTTTATAITTTTSLDTTTASTAATTTMETVTSDTTVTASPSEQLTTVSVATTLPVDSTQEPTTTTTDSTITTTTAAAAADTTTTTTTDTSSTPSGSTATNARTATTTTFTQTTSTSLSASSSTTQQPTTTPKPLPPDWIPVDVAKVYFQMKLKICFNTTFHDDLQMPKSSRYRHYYSQVNSMIDRAFVDTQGFSPSNSGEISFRRYLSSELSDVIDPNSTVVNFVAGFSGDYIIEDPDSTAAIAVSSKMALLSMENETLGDGTIAMLYIQQVSFKDVDEAEKQLTTYKQNPCNDTDKAICASTCQICNYVNETGGIYCSPMCQAPEQTCSINNATEDIPTCSCSKHYLPTVAGCAHQNYIIGIVVGVCGLFLAGLIVVFIIFIIRARSTIETLRERQKVSEKHEHKVEKYKDDTTEPPADYDDVVGPLTSASTFSKPPTAAGRTTIPFAPVPAARTAAVTAGVVPGKLQSPQPTQSFSVNRAYEAAPEDVMSSDVIRRVR